MSSVRLVSALATVALLTACGSETEPTSSTPSESDAVSVSEPQLGLPAGVDENIEGTAGAAIPPDDRQVWIITYGSSSSPLVVDDVSVAGQTVTVQLVQPEGPATMDLVPSTSTVELPSSVSWTDPIDVVIGDQGSVTLDPTTPGSFAWLPTP